jgi:osmotically-inducible protein OsmY
LRLTGTGEPREDELTRVVVAGASTVPENEPVVRDDASSETELAHGEPIRISPQMAAAAEQASSAMAHGVRRFVRNVRDAWITAATETALRFSPAVHAQRLAVHTAHRVVTLSGTVPSRAAEDAAVRVASDVSGVPRVTDALVVVS